jgi:hypothetical protein
LATDSRATRFDAGGQPEVFNVNKLFALNRRCGILSGGAGVSVSLSLALRRQIARHPGPLELEEMEEFALPLLSQGYSRHLETHGPEAEGFRRIYFILAGYVPDSPPPHFKMILLGSEENELPLRRMLTGNVLVMPRNLGMEMRLFKAQPGGGPGRSPAPEPGLFGKNGRDQRRGGAALPLCNHHFPGLSADNFVMPVYAFCRF